MPRHTIHEELREWTSAIAALLLVAAAVYAYVAIPSRRDEQAPITR